MFGIENLPLGAVIAIFLAGAAVIAAVGTRLAGVAEHIARETGIGQAIVGAVFVGISTSLSGTILSIYTAAQGHPELSIANSIGGIPAQTAFLALADMTYRRINLEHAAASLANIAQGAFLIIMLAVPLVAMVAPAGTFWQVHPVTVILVVIYAMGLRVVRDIKAEPMWTPKQTGDTVNEPKQGGEEKKGLPALFTVFFIQMAILGLCGLVVAESAISITGRTGLSESLVGGLFTSISTSLPELITAIAAVRRGALNLAVGDIIGGNSFDILFLAAADVFYREGSLYHEIADKHLLLIGTSIIMTGVLLMGMLRRERVGPAGIGFESVIVLLLYGGMVALLF